MTPRALVVSLLLLASCTLNVARDLDPGDIRGVVLASTGGAPVADADILVEGSAVFTKSDENGRFVLAGLPAGKWTVRIRGEVRECDLQQGLRVEVTLAALGTAADAKDLGELVLKPTRTVTGAIAGHASLAGHTVVLFPYGRTTTADSSGVFTFSNVIPGDYELGVLHVDGGTKRVVRKSVTVADADLPAELLDLTGVTPIVTGNVAGRAFLARSTSHDGISLTFDDANPSETGAQGDVSAVSVPAGVYKVRAVEDERITAGFQDVLVGGDDVQLPDLVLPESTPSCGNSTTDGDGDGVGDACDWCLSSSDTAFGQDDPNRIAMCRGVSVCRTFPIEP